MISLQALDVQRCFSKGLGDHLAHDLALGEVARTDFHAHRHALQFPLVELPARRHVVAIVELDAQTGGSQLVRNRLRALQNASLVRGNRHNDDLNRSDFRRELDAALVAVGHDDGANQTGADAPAGFMRILLRAVLVEVLDFKRLGEIRAKVVARAALKRLAVLHHRLDGIRRARTGKLFLLALLTAVDRNRQILLAEKSR